jgi:hypothetical protein
VRHAAHAGAECGEASERVARSTPRPGREKLMFLADDQLTRVLAVTGTVSGLLGVGIALVAYLRDRPQLIVRSGTGGTTFGHRPTVKRSGRVFLANHGRQPVAIVEAGLTTLRPVSTTRRLVAWVGFLAVFPIWILIKEAARLYDAIHNRRVRAREWAQYGPSRPLSAPTRSRLPLKLDFRVRLGLFRTGSAWLAPGLESEPLLLAPGEVKILLMNWPDRPSQPFPLPVYAFATDSRGRKVIDTHRASPWR